jgi:glycerol kinase
VDDSGGVIFVPALTGLGAPDWDPDARGAMFGLTRGTTRAHVIRATLEAIAYEVRDVVDVMMAEAALPGAALPGATLPRAALPEAALPGATLPGATPAEAGGQPGGQAARGARPRSLRVDGGASANDLLLQIQADQLQVRVERPVIAETTGLGAAFLAGLGTGVWASPAELGATWQLGAAFSPGPRDDEGYARWRKAITQTRGWSA